MEPPITYVLNSAISNNCNTFKYFQLNRSCLAAALSEGLEPKLLYSTIAFRLAHSLHTAYIHNLLIRGVANETHA